MNEKSTEAEKRQEFNKEFWKDFYPLCKRCVNSCKQSWKALEVRCKQFKEIDNIENT